MAYTNSVEDGDVPLEAGTTFSRGPHVGRHRRRRRSSSRPPSTIAGSRPWPGRSTALQLGLLVADPRDRRRRRRVGPLDLDRAAHLPVQRDRQDPHDHRAGQLPGGARRQARFARARSWARACSSGRRSSSSCSSPTSGRRSSSAAILAGMLWMSGASLRWLAVLAAGVVAMVPLAWTYLLRDYQKAAADLVPRRQPGHPGRRLPALPGADRGRVGRVRSARA